uniref:Uncharacterized protein n=1 Tax=Globodera rostochiensis TaxID=31243 RepID=A0A914GQS7_GLORO
MFLILWHQNNTNSSHLQRVQLSGCLLSFVLLILISLLPTFVSGCCDCCDCCCGGGCGGCGSVGMGGFCPPGLNLPGGLGGLCPPGLSTAGLSLSGCGGGCGGCGCDCCNCGCGCGCGGAAGGVYPPGFNVGGLGTGGLGGLGGGLCPPGLIPGLGGVGGLGGLGGLSGGLGGLGGGLGGLGGLGGGLGGLGGNLGGLGTGGLGGAGLGGLGLPTGLGLGGFLPDGSTPGLFPGVIGKRRRRRPNRRSPRLWHSDRMLFDSLDLIPNSNPDFSSSTFADHGSLMKRISSHFAPSSVGDACLLKLLPSPQWPNRAALIKFRR